MTYGVRRVGASEWRELRAIRLEALLDAPLAFGTTYAEAAALDDEWWQVRAEEGATSPTWATFVAITEGGQWVGMAGSGPLDVVPGTAHIHGVYVAPAHRGRQAGLAARLMEAGIEWARDNTDASWLTLGVHEDNARARAFYRRFGFKDTGKVVPFVLDPSKRIHILGYDSFR
jgi:ribosomal protein S18 acetylase RimI-like enzyme